jgi:hypothetical protein
MTRHRIDCFKFLNGLGTLNLGAQDTLNLSAAAMKNSPSLILRKNSTYTSTSCWQFLSRV